MCVSFSVLVELSLEEDEVEGRRSDHEEDVQEGKTVFVRSVVVRTKKERDNKFRQTLCMVVANNQ